MSFAIDWMVVIPGRAHTSPAYAQKRRGERRWAEAAAPSRSRHSHRQVVFNVAHRCGDCHRSPRRPWCTSNGGKPESCGPKSCLTAGLLWLTTGAQCAAQAEFPRAPTPSAPAEAQPLHGSGVGSHSSSSTALRASNLSPPTAPPTRGAMLHHIADRQRVSALAWLSAAQSTLCQAVTSGSTCS